MDVYYFVVYLIQQGIETSVHGTNRWMVHIITLIVIEDISTGGDSMHKPDAGIKMTTEYNVHLRSRTKNGHYCGSMHREYWREWRAKAKADLKRKAKAEMEEMQ